MAQVYRQDPPSGAAVGWTAFAAFMMGIKGIWWVMAGLVGIVNSEFYVATPKYMLEFDATTWGWIHLLVGVVVIIAAAGLFSGAVWARTVGVIVAGLATLAAFAWLPWYPLWAMLFIFAGVSVIWALTIHGRDIVE